MYDNSNDKVIVDRWKYDDLLSRVDKLQQENHDYYQWKSENTVFIDFRVHKHPINRYSFIEEYSLSGSFKMKDTIPKELQDLVNYEIIGEIIKHSDKIKDERLSLIKDFEKFKLEKEKINKELEAKKLAIDVKTDEFHRDLLKLPKWIKKWYNI